MPGLGHSYAPAAGAIGPAAFSTGLGVSQQRNADRLDKRQLAEGQMQWQVQSGLLDAAMRRNQMGAQLQAQSIGQANQQQQDWQRTLLGANLQQQQQMANYALGQQEQQDNVAYRQQLLDQQNQQAQFEMDLNRRPEASAEWQKLQSQRAYIDQAKNDGFLTDQQYEDMIRTHSAQVAGFDINRFPTNSPYPQGQGQYDTWQEPHVFADGTEGNVWWTRDRSGMPVLREDSKIQAEARAKAWLEGQKPQAAGKTADAAKPSIAPQQYAAMYSAVVNAHSQVDELGNTVPPDQAIIDQEMDKIAAGYQRFISTMPGQHQPPPPAAGPGFGGGGGQQAPMQQAPMQPQQQQLPDLRSIYGIPPDQMPPERFALFAVQENPQTVNAYLRARYPGGEMQLMQAGQPDDLALFQTLAQYQAQAPQR